MEKVDVVIVGAGVVGLAIASEIARKDRDIYILEKEKSYGQAASSRNSEVVHAGIYYPKSSLKAELCVRGNALIYRICEKGIAHSRIGKIIVLEMIDEDRIRELEPKVMATAAIYSPSTGIVDVHGLMDYFYREARRNSVIDPLVLDTKVTGLQQKGDGYVVEMVSGGEVFSVEARVVINVAGLHADKIAEMAGMDIEKEGYRIHWCKGDYFSLSGKPPARILVYPMPPTDGVSLGIHTVPDLMGRLKFGPNAYYVNEIDYKVESNRDDFWRDIVSYLPSVRREDLHPD